MKANSLFILAAFVLPALALAQTVEVVSEESVVLEKNFEELENPNINRKEKLIKELEALETQIDIEFEEALDSMSRKINEYAVHRKRECLGDYSTIEITSSGEHKAPQNKLSKEEKKLCLLELIKLRKRFTNSLFNIRRNLLLEQQKNQLNNLEQLRKSSLKELDGMANKLK